MKKITFILISILWTSAFIYVVYLGYLRDQTSQMISDTGYTSEEYQP
jgi:hypothetical protein